MRFFRAHYLREDGLFFVGLDMIGGRLTEVVYAVTAQHILDKSEEFGPLFVRLSTMSGHEDFEAPQSAWTRHQILAAISLRLNPLGVGAVENSFRLLDKPLVAANKKSATPARPAFIRLRHGKQEG